MSLLKELMHVHEKQLLEQHLTAHNGNRSRTAIALGISRRGLLNKLKEHGINIPRPSRGQVPVQEVQADTASSEA
jgi:DNA-binding NtrC family response regulator